MPPIKTTKTQTDRSRKILPDFFFFSKNVCSAHCNFKNLRSSDIYHITATDSPLKTGSKTRSGGINSAVVLLQGFSQHKQSCLCSYSSVRLCRYVQMAPRKQHVLPFNTSKWVSQFCWHVSSFQINIKPSFRAGKKTTYDSEHWLILSFFGGGDHSKLCLFLHRGVALLGRLQVRMKPGKQNPRDLPELVMVSRSRRLCCWKKKEKAR